MACNGIALPLPLPFHLNLFSRISGYEPQFSREMLENSFYNSHFSVLI
jgi:hypothetical protein